MNEEDKGLQPYIGKRISWVPTVAFAVLAFSLPETWNRTSGPLRHLVSLMVSTIPVISRISQVSALPGIAETLLSLVWATAVISVPFALRLRVPLDRTEDSPVRRRLWQSLFVLLLVYWGFIAVLVRGVAPDSTAMAQRYGEGLMVLGSSRLTLWLGSSLIYFVIVLLLALPFLIARNAGKIFKIQHRDH